MYVEPDGPNFELPVIGRVSRTIMASLPSRPVESLPDLLSNKNSLVFGGIPVGKSALVIMLLCTFRNYASLHA
jgi:hypothetical protein